MSTYPMYEGKETCERCHKPIEPGSAVMLELNLRNGLYYQLGKVKEEDSQGCFAFGKDCAEKVLANKGKCVEIGLAKRNGC